MATHRGLEEFKVAPIRFCNSPPYAQRQTDLALREEGCTDFAKGYINNILIYSITFNEHLQHIKQLLDGLQGRNFTLSSPKAHFSFPSLLLLGQRVDAFSIYTPQDKITAIAKLAFPATLADLKTYLGITGWLRRFVAYYCQLAEPLQKEKTKLLKDAPTSGYARANYAKSTRVNQDREDLQTSYQAMQSAFQDKRFLAHIDPARQLYVGVNASKQRGFRVIVYHIKDKSKKPEDVKGNQINPILFLSKMLSPAKQRYYPTELETAYLVWTIQKIRHMVKSTNKPTIVLTDHAATTGIATQTSLNSSSTDKLNMGLIQASQYLSQFQLIVKYIPGRQHIVPDALSRLQSLASREGNNNTDVLGELNAAYHITTISIKPAFKKQLQAAYSQEKH